MSYTPLSDILESEIESELGVNPDYNILSAPQKLQFSNTVQEIVKNLYIAKSKVAYQANTLAGSGFITTTILVSQGGTGLTAVTAGALLYGAGTSPLSLLLIGAANTVLQSNGSVPVWNVNPTFGNVVCGTISSGKVTVSTGGGASYPNSLLNLNSTSSFGGLSINVPLSQNAFIELLQNSVKFGGLELNNATSEVIVGANPLEGWYTRIPTELRLSEAITVAGSLTSATTSLFGATSTPLLPGTGEMQSVASVSTDFRGNLALYDSRTIATGVGGQVVFGGKYTGSTYTEWAGIYGQKVNATDGNFAGKLIFKTRPNGGSMTTALTLDDAQAATFASTISSGAIMSSGASALLTDNADRTLTLGFATASSTPRKAILFNPGGFANVGTFNVNSNGDKIILMSDAGLTFDGRIGVGDNSNLWIKSLVSSGTAGKIQFYTGTNTTTPTLLLAGDNTASFASSVTFTGNLTGNSTSVWTENYNGIVAPGTVGVGIPIFGTNIVSGVLLVNNTAAASNANKNSPAIQLKHFSWNPTAGASQENSWYVHNWAFQTSGTAGGVLAFTCHRPSDPNTYTSFVIDEIGRTLIGYTKSQGSNYFGFIGENLSPWGIILAHTSTCVIGWPENGITTNFHVTGNMSTGGATISSTTSLITPAGVAGKSSLRILHGVAPTSPVDGDIWTTTAGIFVRINGVTVGPLT